MGSSRLRYWLPALVVWAVGAIGAFVLPSHRQFMLSLVLIAAVTGAILVIVVGYVRIITLASGAIVGIGAYASALLADHGVPFVAAVVMGGMASGVAGFVLGSQLVRFRGHEAALITLVFQVVVVIVIRELEFTGGSGGKFVKSPTLFGLDISSDFAYLIFVSIVVGLLTLAVTVMALGRSGRVLQAISDSERGAAAFGSPVPRQRIFAFTFASLLLGIVGGVFGPLVRIIDPEQFNVTTSVVMLSYPIIGGMYSLWGGLAGGALFRLLPEVLRPFAEYQELILAGVILVVLVVAPGGLARLAAWMWDRFHPGLNLPTRRAPLSTELEPGRPRATVKGDAPVLNGEGAALLRARNVKKGFGGLQALVDVSLTVPASGIHGIIGPNGAGKTTFVNLVSGFIQVDSGDITFDQASTLNWSPWDRASHGITRTFQQVAIFGSLTVEENILLGTGANNVGAAAAASLREWVLGSRPDLHRVLRAATSVGLEHRLADRADALSLGEQRRLEIARAIVSQPRLLLLDEPVSGLTGREVDRVGDVLRSLVSDSGMSVLVIEHNVGFIGTVCDSLRVMYEGRVLAEGSTPEVLQDPSVREAYFGDGCPHRRKPERKGDRAGG